MIFQTRSLRRIIEEYFYLILSFLTHSMIFQTRSLRDGVNAAFVPRIGYFRFSILY